MDGQDVELDALPLGMEMQELFCRQGEIIHFGLRDPIFWIAENFAPAGFDFNKMEDVVFAGDDIYLVPAVSPIAMQNVKPLLLQVFHAQLFACFTGLLMKGHVDMGWGKGVSKNCRARIIAYFCSTKNTPCKPIVPLFFPSFYWC